jgi:alginate export protein
MVGIRTVADPAASSAVIIAMIVLLLFVIPVRVAAQVLRDPPTPYHFLRYDDTPDDQRSLAWPNDFWEPLKFIPLDFAPGSYINFGGEDRERVEHFSDPFFGLTPRGTTTYDMHRLLLQGDLHIGDTFRGFIQFGNHLVTSSSMSPPTDVDRFDLQQGFADLKTSVGPDASLTFRGGRQEITFGSSRLVDVREGPNIRLSFDGGRAFYESPDLRADAFVVSPVIPERGYFDDHADPGQAFWGLHGVMPVEAVPGLHADLYYLGLDRQNASFDSGTANERRHSLGARLWGRAGAWDYDTEGVFQFGDFGSRDIRAWTIASNTGYTVKSLWGEPRLGLQADAASGGGRGGTLKSFNPLFPKFAYFTEASINTPINLLDAFPSVTVQPIPNFAITSGIDLLWRYSVHDGFYQPPGVPLVPGSANNKRFLGEQYNLHAEWQATSHINVNAVYVHFFADGFLKAAKAKDIDFLGVWTSYEF